MHDIHHWSLSQNSLFDLILHAVPKELRMESSRCKSFALMMPQMAIYGEGHIYFSGGNFPKPELNM